VRSLTDPYSAYEDAELPVKQSMLLLVRWDPSQLGTSDVRAMYLCNCVYNVIKKWGLKHCKHRIDSIQRVHQAGQICGEGTYISVITGHAKFRVLYTVVHMPTLESHRWVRGGGG
jgi:hypothetical protein